MGAKSKVRGSGAGREMRRRWVGAGLAAALLGAIAVLSRVVTRAQIEGWSMAPLLREGERVLVNRLVYRLRPPRAGDIVLARVAAVPGGWTIKRVAGVNAHTSDGRSAPRMAAIMLIGENLAASTDSRHFGPIPGNDVLGRAWYRYWPPERRGRL